MRILHCDGLVCIDIAEEFMFAVHVAKHVLNCYLPSQNKIEIIAEQKKILQTLHIDFISLNAYTKRRLRQGRAQISQYKTLQPSKRTNSIDNCRSLIYSYANKFGNWCTVCKESIFFHSCHLVSNFICAEETFIQVSFRC